MDRDLVEQARAGDREAFNALARLSIGRLYGLAQLILRDPDRASDATQDGLLTRRHVTSQLRGTLSLSPTGEGPSLRMTSHMNWWNVWPVPGTEGDGVQTNRGVDIKVQGPGIGSGFMLAGNFPPDEPAHGHFTAFTDESLVLLCEALGQ